MHRLSTQIPAASAMFRCLALLLAVRPCTAMRADGGTAVGQILGSPPEVYEVDMNNSETIMLNDQVWKCCCAPHGPEGGAAKSLACQLIVNRLNLFGYSRSCSSLKHKGWHSWNHMNAKYKDYQNYGKCSILQPSASKVTKIMTWNVLASTYTMFNSHHHNSSQYFETVEQTVARYTLAGQTILEQSPDLAFLQEVEPCFLETKPGGILRPRWSNSAASLHSHYDAFLCSKLGRPGTAILVKKGGTLSASIGQARCIGGVDATGGSSKIAAMLPLRLGTGFKQFVAVSAHFPWNKKASMRKTLMELVGKQLAMRHKFSSIVLAGDFNADSLHNDGVNLKALEESTWLRSLQRVALPPGTVTGLSPDFSGYETIDHIYVSDSISVREASALYEPKNPYVERPGHTSAGVQVASDHVPVMATIVL